MRIVLPFRGELGIVIRFHVPAIAALAGDVLVCHEAGMEALYPDRRRVIVSQKADDGRGWTVKMDREYVGGLRDGLAELHPGAEFISTDGRDADDVRRFVPQPHVEQGVQPCDVFVAPRLRAGPPVLEARNWDRWPEMCRLLGDEGLTLFVGGTAATSYEVDGDDCAWSYPRTLDACIEAMHRSKVVVATDSGLAHLAMLCGRPLVLIGADGGRVAPGRRTDEDAPYWKIRLEHYYRAANHMNAPIKLVPDGWAHPDAMLRAVEDVIEATR